MKKLYVFCFLVLVFVLCFSFSTNNNQSSYKNYYTESVLNFQKESFQLNIYVQQNKSKIDLDLVKIRIHSLRKLLKQNDFWLRYLEPTTYKFINGPLPVEWETEVFEKFEKPYKRIGKGLTLAELYLEEDVNADTLLNILSGISKGLEVYKADSITKHLSGHEHFYLANRLYLLNLAAIYTTGFECPNTDSVIAELKHLIKQTTTTYNYFNTSFQNYALSDDYLVDHKAMLDFVYKQPTDFEKFNHFEFIKNYVNPLFKKNQLHIQKYKIVSSSFVDYSLNNKTLSIFDKNLYTGQSTKGVFHRIYDQAILKEIEAIGKQLFYDPILSKNNERSCGSCHSATQFFTDTLKTTALQFNRKDVLPRNAPSLVNAQFNHLLMLDGKHISLQNQLKDVATNPIEMACDENELLKKVLSCKEYKSAFEKFAKLTPVNPKVSIEHIASAVTLYYGKFSNYYAPFDDAINYNKPLNSNAIKGFNLFMSKAECATCHFAPHFNGVKPPYVGSEFEVLGTPADTVYSKLSSDLGRYQINPAEETSNAFRTGTLKNISKTKPYMHNGVFNNLEQVVEFYNNGGGQGRGLKVANQTLSGDSLHLSKAEVKQLVSFMQSLTEAIPFEPLPSSLPKSKSKILNKRIVNGTY